MIAARQSRVCLARDLAASVQTQVTPKNAVVGDPKTSRLRVVQRGSGTSAFRISMPVLLASGDEIDVFADVAVNRVDRALSLVMLTDEITEPDGELRDDATRVVVRRLRRLIES